MLAPMQSSYGDLYDNSIAYMINDVMFNRYCDSITYILTTMHSNIDVCVYLDPSSETHTHT